MLALAALTGLSSADEITLRVGTNTTEWTITRQSENLKFNYSQYVEGTISPVEYRGRLLDPYASSYEEVDVNDLRLRDRTAAQRGNYASEEKMVLQADTTTPTLINYSYEMGTFYFQFTEEWPAILRSSKSIRYSGEQINSRQFAGNNLDYAGANLLYNRELSRDSNIDMLITRMNATATLTNDSVLSAEFMPTKETYYDISTYTTGIADLKYGFSSPSADVKKVTYPLASEGEERYYGVYEITRSIHMKSNFPRYEPDDDWLPCCYEGIYEINQEELNRS